MILGHQRHLYSCIYMTTVDRSLQSIRPTLHVLLRPQGQSICAQEDFIINFHVCVLKKI